MFTYLCYVIHKRALSLKIKGRERGEEGEGEREREREREREGGDGEGGRVVWCGKDGIPSESAILFDPSLYFTIHL